MSGIWVQMRKALVRAADCEESNNQAMEKIISLSQDGAVGSDFKYRNPVPEAVHLGNCFKSAFANSFLYCRGERINLSNLRGVTYSGRVVYVTDTGHRRIAYKAVVQSVFLEPKKIKVQNIHVKLEEVDVQIPEASRKKDLVKA